MKSVFLVVLMAASAAQASMECLLTHVKMEDKYQPATVGYSHGKPTLFTFDNSANSELFLDFGIKTIYANGGADIFGYEFVPASEEFPKAISLQMSQKTESTKIRFEGNYGATYGHFANKGDKSAVSSAGIKFPDGSLGAAILSCLIK